MFNKFRINASTSVLVLMLMITFIVVSFVATDTANADDNVVCKQLEIRYYYCSSWEYENGTPLYSRCRILVVGGMEDADHPEYTEEEVWGWRPVYEYRGFWPFVERVIVAWDRYYIRTDRIHHDHSYRTIWSPDKIYKFTDRYHWKCR